MTEQATLERVACNLCGADDAEVVLPARYDAAGPADARELRASASELLVDPLVRCRRCGLQYVSPRLAAGEVLQGYTDAIDEAFVSQAAGRELTFRRSLKAVERHAGARGRLLDVGTAGGSFLAVARERGWDVQGCEPSEWLAAWGREHYGVPIQQGTIFDVEEPPGSFDVVTLWDVLEHTPDPRAVLERASELLRTDGLLVINYPDIGSAPARLMGRRWVFLLSAHLYYFTPETIGKLLDRTGFAVVERRRHWQTLSVGYIVERMGGYVPLVAKPAARAVRALRLDRLQAPYWIGQTLVVARKTP